MKKIMAILIMAAMTALPLGCTNMTKTQQGAVTGGAAGALGGAALGAVTGGSASKGALIGGAVGAVAGGLYGHNQE